MLSNLFSTFIYDPLYNALILFVDLVPGGDVGIAVILLTILVKVLLIPISIKAVRTQILMRELEEPLKLLQEQLKDDRQKQATEIMALYKSKGVNPFSSILLIFLQLPIIFGLYWVFFRGGLPEIDLETLYTFMRAPDVIKMEFLGIVDMAGRSAVLALLAGITQFYQAKLSLPAPKPKKAGDAPSFKDDLARSLHLQMRYVLPIIVVVISFTISAAIALYWTTSNIVSILQEWYVRKHIRNPAETRAVETAQPAESKKA
jgi:YidC/Oxa1 family membrane protein insertase